MDCAYRQPVYSRGARPAAELDERAMREYQYYAWQTVDRLLSAAEQAAVSTLSSHIEVSASEAVVTYNWGDFKHDPRQVLARYFDAHLYLTNWGSRVLIFRFPRGLLGEAAVKTGCPSNPRGFTIQTPGRLASRASRDRVGRWTTWQCRPGGAFFAPSYLATHREGNTLKLDEDKAVIDPSTYTTSCVQANNSARKNILGPRIAEGSTFPMRKISEKLTRRRCRNE